MTIPKEATGMHHHTKLAWVGVIVSLTGMLIGLMPWVSILEESPGLSLLFKMRGRRPAPRQVLVVGIDRDSAPALGLPDEIDKWPRSLHARLVERLTAEGAALIVFDLIFDQSQTSEDDQRFAQAIRLAGNVVLAQSIAVASFPLKTDNGGGLARVAIEKIVSPIPIFSEAAAGLAPFPLPKIPVKLHQFWAFKPGAGDVPTLPVVALHAYAHPLVQQLIQRLTQLNAVEGRITDAPRTSADNLMARIRRLRDVLEANPALANRLLRSTGSTANAPTGAIDDGLRQRLVDLHMGSSSRYFNFFGPAGSIQTIPYQNVILETAKQHDDAVLPDIQGKVVFVGQTNSTWPNSKDGFYTLFSKPSGIDISGVELAAIAFANLMEGSTLKPLAQAHRAGILLGLGLIGALLCFRLSAGWSAVSLLMVGGAYLSAAYYRFADAGIWYPIVFPLFIQLPLTWLGFLVWSHHTVQRDRRNIREAFGYYMPDAVVNQLAQNVKAVHAEGQILYGVLLITDAERYTSISESMDPASLSQLMDRYFKLIFAAIRANGGLVLQVVGDSVISLWPAMDEDVGQKVKACQAALDVAGSVDRFNRDTDLYKLPTRIGLHAGTMMLSNVGAMDHFEYWPVGDIVNTASRLEGLNKFLGTRILVSSELITSVGKYKARCMGRFVFKGKTQPVTVFELVEETHATTMASAEGERLFAAGLDAFQNQDWRTAGKTFARVLATGGMPEQAKFFMKMCARYSQAPPCMPWEGAIYLEDK